LSRVSTQTGSNPYISWPAISAVDFAPVPDSQDEHILPDSSVDDSIVSDPT
jgi:hypothetical protein